MRPIDLRQLRRAADLSQLDGLSAAIAGVGEAQRKAFIDSNEGACSAIRHALWTVGSMKCWYSEASLQECEGQVEHYRPKKRTSQARRSGYWWRAFDWRNLRLAHPTVNRRKRDYMTGRFAGKGSYFPLRYESHRASCRAEEANEEPVLLDPAVAADTRLLCFSEGSGSPCPRYRRDQDEWLHQRAADSIEYYHLHEASWNARRADLMAEVKKLCEQLEKLAAQQPRNDVAYNQKIDEIVAYIGPFAEFSSACLQVIRERGLLEHLL